MNFISKRADVDKTAYIGKGVVILGPTVISRGVIIEDYSIIGKPSLDELYRFRDMKNKKRTYYDYDACVKSTTIIEEDCIIGRNSALYSGCHLGCKVECEDNTRVGYDTTIGENTRIMYNALIYNRVSIGHHCCISGFCCNDTKIGDYVSMFGQTVHSYLSYPINATKRRNPSPRIFNGVTIGFGSQIIGGISIGEFSYVTAGTVVSKDVPPKTVVTGVNLQCPLENWKGKLRERYLPFQAKKDE